MFYFNSLRPSNAYMQSTHCPYNGHYWRLLFLLEVVEPEFFSLAFSVQLILYRYEVRCSISTHWGRVTNICVSNLSIIVWDNAFPPDRHQAIVLTNAGILLIRTRGTILSEILSGIDIFAFKNAFENVVCEFLSRPKFVNSLLFYEQNVSGSKAHT